LASGGAAAIGRQCPQSCSGSANLPYRQGRWKYALEKQMVGRVVAPPASYRSCVLALLLSVSALNAIDRLIINVLVEPIRQDLQLSDTQIGLMTGLAFALFYAAMAFPIARLAERRNRPGLIASCLAFWSFFTAVCGLAQSFLELFAARVLVGI